MAEHAAAAATKLLEQPPGCVGEDNIAHERLASEYLKLTKAVAASLVETESFLRAAQRFEIVGAGDISRQSRLDADHHIAMARNRTARERDIGTIEIMQLTAGTDDAGTRDVHQQAADLRRAARDCGAVVDVIGAARAGIDPAGDAVLQRQRRAVFRACRVAVYIDQTRRDDFAACVDHFGAAGDRRFDRNDLAAGNRDIAHGVEADRRIDHATALYDKID